MKKLKQSRAASFVAVALVYIFAIIVVGRCAVGGLRYTECVVSCSGRGCQYIAVFLGQHPDGRRQTIPQGGLCRI